MTTIQAHLILKGIFDQIVQEAEKNPNLAARLLAVLPAGVIAEVRTRPRRGAMALAELASVNPVMILRGEGEIALRAALGRLTKTQILEIAKSHQLILANPARAKNAAKTVIVNAVIEAAKFRLSERAA